MAEAVSDPRPPRRTWGRWGARSSPTAGAWRPGTRREEAPAVRARRPRSRIAGPHVGTARALRDRRARAGALGWALPPRGARASPDPGAALAGSRRSRGAGPPPARRPPRSAAGPRTAAASPAERTDCARGAGPGAPGPADPGAPDCLPEQGGESEPRCAPRLPRAGRQDRTPAAGDGRPAVSAAAAGRTARGPGRATPGAARAGAEPRAAASLSDPLPPGVPRLARCSGRAHRVAAAVGPRPQRRGPCILRLGPALPTKQRRRRRAPALRPGALLPTGAARPQPHFQLLRRAGLQRLGGGARRKWLGRGKEPDTGARGSFPDLLRDFFRVVLQEAACGPGDGGHMAGAAGQRPDRDLRGRLKELAGLRGHRGSLPPGRWGARENCGCIYRLRVRLLDIYENEVVKFSASPNPVLQWTERSCRQVSHVFTNFGKGIRYVSFEQYGRDMRSWVGHYGALVTHSSVRIRIRPS